MASDYESQKNPLMGFGKAAREFSEPKNERIFAHIVNICKERDFGVIVGYISAYGQKGV